MFEDILSGTIRCETFREKGYDIGVDFPNDFLICQALWTITHFYFALFKIIFAFLFLSLFKKVLKK